MIKTPGHISILHEIYIACWKWWIKLYEDFIISSPVQQFVSSGYTNFHVTQTKQLI